MTDQSRLSTKMPPDALALGHSGDPKIEFKKSIRYDMTRKKRITNKSAWIPAIVKKKLASCIQKDSGAKISMAVVSSPWRSAGLGNRYEASFDSTYTLVSRLSSKEQCIRSNSTVEGAGRGGFKSSRSFNRCVTSD
jgi:hypothetical protein